MKVTPDSTSFGRQIFLTNQIRTSAMVTALRYSVVMPLQWVLLLHLYERKVLLIVWMVTKKR